MGSRKSENICQRKFISFHFLKCTQRILTRVFSHRFRKTFIEESGKPTEVHIFEEVRSFGKRKASEMVFSVPQLIRKKRDGLSLTTEEIKFFVQCVVTRNIDDAQIGAMLMAVYLNKLTTTETVSLTKSMIDMGETLSFSNYGRDLLVDKHSTGGVGDKISLVLAPALAACGLKVPMISGRGLGYTGGTLDKLESIPGFQVHLDYDQMNDCLSTAGCFICGATSSLAPADGILYKIRDITATVEEPSLIVASILSKKAAEGIGTLVMDVKYGRGSSFKTETEAKKTAELLEEVGRNLNLNVRVIMSEMNVPLGKFVGNSLEVVESVMCLRNEIRNSVTDLAMLLGGVTLECKGLAKTIDEGKKMIESTFENSTALDRFQKMLTSQGVSKSHAEDLCRGDYWKVLPKAPQVTPFRSPQRGVIVAVDALDVAKACWQLGAGRANADSRIDHSCGVVLLKTVGESLEKGEPWIEVHHSQAKLHSEVENLIQNSLSLREN